MALTGTTKIDISLTRTKVNDLTTSKDSVVRGNSTPYSITWADGEGANQAEEVWHDTRTLAAGANETLDIYDALIQPMTLADLITFTKIKGIVIINNGTAGSDATLDIGGAAANAWLGIVKAVSDIIPIQPGGQFKKVSPDANGMTVGASNSNLKLANTSAGSYSLTYDIIIWGTI